MDTTPLDRRPLPASLLLLAGAAAYAWVLVQLVGIAAALPMPQWLKAAVPWKYLRFWIWTESLHLLTVAVAAAPFAWALARLLRRRLLPAGLLVACPATAWMVVDYFSMRGQAPDAPAVLNLCYGLDTLEVALAPALLSLLLRR